MIKMDLHWAAAAISWPKHFYRIRTGSGESLIWCCHVNIALLDSTSSPLPHSPGCGWWRRYAAEARWGGGSVSGNFPTPSGWHNFCMLHQSFSEACGLQPPHPLTVLFGCTCTWPNVAAVHTLFQPLSNQFNIYWSATKKLKPASFVSQPKVWSRSTIEMRQRGQNQSCTFSLFLADEMFCCDTFI